MLALCSNGKGRERGNGAKIRKDHAPERTTLGVGKNTLSPSCFPHATTTGAGQLVPRREKGVARCWTEKGIIVQVQVAYSVQSPLPLELDD